MFKQQWVYSKIIMHLKNMPLWFFLHATGDLFLSLNINIYSYKYGKEERIPWWKIESLCTTAPFYKI